MKKQQTHRVKPLVRRVLTEQARQDSLRSRRERLGWTECASTRNPRFGRPALVVPPANRAPDNAHTTTPGLR